MDRVPALFATLLIGSTAAFGAPHHRASHRSVGQEPAITLDSVNAAAPGGNGIDPSLIIKAEALLDRRHFSPGQIDGANSDNFKKALSAFQQANNLSVTGQLDSDTWSALAGDAKDMVLKPYTIAGADVAGPFAKRIPANLVQMARLRGLSYKTPREELAEKFHMSDELLGKLNPHAHFDRAGTEIVVAGVQPMALRDGRDTVEAVPPKKDNREGAVAAIVVDKPAREVRGYDKNGKLLRFYPATIGSAEKPAPSGTFEVRRVAWNPDYHYDPKFAWKGVRTKRPLTVRPGPNNPVGLVWIDLSAPSYGMHGTPEPSRIGKAESHGCIRLTNWDALDLAAIVHRGTVVKFEDEDSPVIPATPEATR